jgi:hypothetical protein
MLLSCCKLISLLVGQAILSPARAALAAHIHPGHRQPGQTAERKNTGGAKMNIGIEG